MLDAIANTPIIKDKELDIFADIVRDCKKSFSKTKLGKALDQVELLEIEYGSQDKDVIQCLEYLEKEFGTQLRELKEKRGKHYAA